MVPLRDDKANVSYGSIECDPAQKNSAPKRVVQWYTNMLLINCAEFAAEASRGVVLATLFLYAKSLGGSLSHMGLLTSLFSVGRLISSMLFGWMCDHYSFRSVYLVSSSICLVGNIIYLLAEDCATGSLIVLSAARFIVGFGAGNRSVCRADVAAMTTVSQRLPYMTILSTVEFLAYALTPGLGSLVANTDMFVFGVHMNQFTAPGVILVILNALSIVGMLVAYDASVKSSDGPQESAPSARANTVRAESISLPNRIIYIGATVYIFLNFNARGMLSVFETVNIPLFLEATGKDPSTVGAVVEASNFQFYLGLLGLVSYFSIEYFRNSISDVSWVQLGFLSLLAGNAVLAVVPAADMSIVLLAVAEMLVWSVGCPITTAVGVAAFSKLLGGRPQGTLMGLFGSAASVSRIILPLIPAAISTLTPVFCVNISLCVLSVLTLWWFNRLVHTTRMDLLTDAEKEYPPNVVVAKDKL
ncbi:unnamed protein product [Phytophthora fragariaefolia]|uniref:Unnamed protein product n=1 Tax=Phytophthora fragariaefolia TaxID=1490495 RepID=A0A9W6XY92_9STRA|nr:unnamed protein product [Phytophthora fragariaefolia]